MKFYVGNIFYRRLFLVLAFFLFAVKLYIVHDVPIWALPGSMRDDLLMVTLADNIVHGKWLGEYSEFTFVKGITYPLFLAVNYMLHIPAVLANSILYALAVISFVVSVKPMLKKDGYLFVVYSVLMLSPISYSAFTMQRIYRDDIYYSLILILVSCYVAIIVRGFDEKIKGWLWLLTVDFVAVMFCREDSIWVIPLMLVFSIMFIKRGISANLSIKTLCKAMFMPFAGLLSAYMMFGAVNFFAYGKFIINEMQYSSFSKAYALLCSIDTDEKMPKVKLSNTAIKKAYEISPTFCELKTYYDGGPGNLWRHATKEWRENNVIPEGEIGASHSMWAFRNCVAELGCYDNPQHADDFYNAVINELRDGEQLGRLHFKKGFNVPLFSALSFDEWLTLANDIVRTLKYTVSEEEMYLNMNLKVINRNDDIALFEKIARQQSIRNCNFQGWVVSKNNKIFVIGGSTGSDKVYPVKCDNAEDVKEHFYKNGVVYDDENYIRFFGDLPIGGAGELFLEFKDENNNLLKTIKIEENSHRQGIQEDEHIIYNIENVYIPKMNFSMKSAEKHAEITKTVSNVYSKFNMGAIFLSFVLFLVELIYAFRIGIKQEFCVLSLLWGYFFLRIFVIAYNTTTAFYSISYLYLSPCYPLMAAIIGLQGVMAIEYLRNRFGGKVCNG